jgi:hypothetical protein
MGYLLFQKALSSAFSLRRNAGSRSVLNLMPIRKTAVVHTTVFLILIVSGHSGCVNCLEWNRSGELLASGSDDKVNFEDRFVFFLKENKKLMYSCVLYSPKICL